MLLRGIRLCSIVYPEAAVKRRIDLIEQLSSVDCLGGQNKGGNECCRIVTQNDEAAVTTKNTADRRVIAPLLYLVLVFLSHWHAVPRASITNDRICAFTIRDIMGSRSQ